MANRPVISNIQRQISIYEYSDYSDGVTIPVDTIITYKGLMFRVHTSVVKTQKFADVLSSLTPNAPTCIIIQKATHGLSQFAPVYFTGISVEAAISNTADKLATHIVIEKTVDWLLLVSSGTFNYPAHGLGTGQLYCSSTVAGTNSTVFTDYINPTIKIYDGANFEIVTNIKSIYNAPVVETEGMTLVGFYQGDSATPQSWTVNLDGDSTPRMRLVVHIDGFSSGGNTSSSLYVRFALNNDTAANYNSVYNYTHTSNLSTATNTSAAGNFTNLGTTITGYYARIVYEGNLKTVGTPRVFRATMSYRTVTSFVTNHYYQQWNNSASKVTTINFVTSQYTKYRVYVYLGE